MAERKDKDFFKFLRTRHIFDAGGNGVTRDDLVLTPKEADLFLEKATILIEEKVDGANVGISIDKNYVIKVQNRSHYVNSSTHKQFSMLDAWVEKHSTDLFSILEPSKHILFGEWLYAKHSIPYTNLPDYFLAFDIYDKENESFLSVEERNIVLEKTSIHHIRKICCETNLTITRLKEILNTKSSYYDGFVEGIVIRKVGKDKKENFKSYYFEQRAKLVRPDFIQQIQGQWTKQKFQKNRLSHYD